MEKRLKFFNEVQIMRNGMEEVLESNGHVELSVEELTCGESCSLEIIYTTGEDPIYPGGVLRFTIPFGFTKPQIGMPVYPGYTTAYSRASGVTVKTKIVENDWWKRGPDRTKMENVSEHVGTHVWVEIMGNTLRQGDQIVLVYGDLSYSQFGAGETCLTTGPVQFDVATDQTGRMEAPYSGFYLTENPPTIMIKPKQAVAYEVILPSDIIRNENDLLHVFARDEYRNLDTQYRGTAVVEINGELVEEISFQEEDCGIKTLRIQTRHRNKISAIVRGTQDGLIGESNTGIVHESRPEKIHFWGDLHGHTGIQWGRGSGRSYYEFAKEVAALDFCALTDPDAGRYTNDNRTAKESLSCIMSDEQWSLIQSINQSFYTPGEFVPILGYEYHNDAPNPEFGGDRNVYFDNYKEKILRNVDEGSYCPSEMWETMRREGINAITIPHHPAKKVMLGSWDVHDEEIQRLVEIYSSWGNSECDGCERPIIGGAVYDEHSVQYALSRGYRLGFVGGSDTHAGNPGYAFWVFSEHVNSYRGGLTCCLATDLTLPSIFQALQSRSVYATTGERILLDFKINGVGMGQEISYGDNQRRLLEIEVYGTAEVDRVDIISMGQNVYSLQGDGKELSFCWADERYLPDGWTYYYVRVHQKDKAMAWSSPIWVS